MTDNDHPDGTRGSESATSAVTNAVAASVTAVPTTVDSPVLPEDVIRHLIRVAPYDALVSLRGTNKELCLAIDSIHCRHLVLSQSLVKKGSDIHKVLVWRPHGWTVSLRTPNFPKAGCNGNSGGGGYDNGAAGAPAPLTFVRPRRKPAVVRLLRSASRIFRRPTVAPTQIVPLHEDNGPSDGPEPITEPDTYDSRFAFALVLDLEQSAFRLKVDCPALTNVRLIRQNDLRFPYAFSIPHTLAVGFHNFTYQTTLELLHPEATFVRFLDFRPEAQRTVIHTGRVRRLVLNVLLDLSSPPTFQTGDFRPPFITPLFECDEIFVLLTPFRSPSPSAARHEAADESEVGQEEWRFVHLLALYMPLLWLHIPPNRSIVFVGTESWEHTWLSETTVWRPNATPFGVVDVELHLTKAEPGRVGERFMEWLWSSTATALGEARADEVMAAISCMSMDDFRAHIGDAEIFPFIMSPSATS